MLHIARQIVNCLKASSLPTDPTDLFSDLFDAASNRFVYQESSHWDYKAEFPFSFSDGYFGGILRLICAFHNTFGGIIIFGVHDQARDPGHNKVVVNIERLNNVVRESLSSPVELIHKEYFLGSTDDKTTKIDVVLVSKRRMGAPPIRFVTAIGPYTPGIPWIRIGHEVVEPGSTDLPQLYSSRSDYGVADDEAIVQIEHALPPSPATLKEFIGRRDALDHLYEWLFTKDEPRTFLFGKGGSGKSTIAYEFARMVSETGGNIGTKQGSPIDFVVYISAKLTAIDPLSRSIVESHSHDFSTAKELYQAILLLIGWTKSDLIESYSEEILLSELGDLLNTIQPLIVIDDIDTLTTAGRDPGMDSLYRLLLRSRAGGKVLYTMRNAPTQSLANAIEVRGLDEATELPQFVATCCRQFRVPEPGERFVQGPLTTATERRPLAVEVLIGLRRTAGNYDQALRLFQGREGDQVREYLFQREYNALPTDNHARLFLAALALLGRPASFSELQSILQASSERLNDSISQTLEMFLQTNTGAAGETMFSLGAATESFLRDASRGLAFYDQLRANVQYFKSPFLPINRQMSQLEFDVMQLFRRQDFPRAADPSSRAAHATRVSSRDNPTPDL